MTVKAKTNPGSVAHWPRPVIERLDRAVLAITPFTLAEEKIGYLVAGWGPERVAEYERRLSRLLLIPLDLEIVQTYARLNVESRATGKTFGYHDLWIGATAVSRGVPLVTCDERQCDIPGVDAIFLPPVQP